MPVELVPANTLGDEELAALFNAAYEGYIVPITVDAPGLRRMVETCDVVLEASRVAVADGDRAGVANLALRGDRAWIAGMGVVSSARRQGVGERLMRAVIGQAGALGAREVWLEVIDGNDAALRLYDRLGFEHVRDLELWTLDEADGTLAGEVPWTEAVERLRELRDRPAPWQCAEETLSHGEPPRGIATGGGAALFREAGGRVSLFQLAGEPEPVLAALRSLGPVSAFNVPVGPATEALERLGGRRDLRQHELALAL